jgi:uroporphyrinogen decarboxylase
VSEKNDAERENFAGLRVVALESRRSEEIAELISSFGGIPFVSPSMREVPLEDAGAAIEFAKQLLTGRVDIVIFLTGVGFNYLLEAIEKNVPRERFLNSLRDIVTVVRGPKPADAMRQVALEPSYRVPEPNTWRELLESLDRNVPLANQVVALQEYGESNPSLIAGLEARGAQLLRVPVYAWDLPENIEPLEENIRAITRGERDVLLVTSSWQVVSLHRVARSLGLELDLKHALSKMVICSIGPTSSEGLLKHRLTADLVPTRPKLGPFIREAAAQCRGLLARKQAILTRLSQPGVDSLDRSAAWYDGPFMRACRREPTTQTPVWLMRQAGRYLPEYRQLRSQVGFLELCKRPDLCAEIMVTTVEKIGVDAAIIFSDLLPMLEPMGFDLEYSPGDGPLIHNPIRDQDDVDRMIELDTTDSLHFVMETVRLTRENLPANIPLIGFSGAPFTLASYAIEGGASRHFLHTKTLMWRDAGAWNELMSRLTRAVLKYLQAQIAAGAQAVQLFDSWVGCLGPDDYRQFVLPYMKEIMRQLPAGVPVISFMTGNPALLPLLADASPTIVGLDWRVRFDEAWQVVGHHRGVQGNLDPAALLAEPDAFLAAAEAILKMANRRAGHIFNLGHGVLPQTPVDHVRRLVDWVHTYSEM